MGMISIQFVLPWMGGIRESYGAAASFRYVSYIPGFLVFIFGALFLYYQSKGGYRPVTIGGVVIEEPSEIASPLAEL
jgi:hypothetical protein